MFKVELIPIAEDEMSDAYDWYEEQSAGLGDRLYKEISHYLNLIEKKPLYFQVKYPGDVRAATLKKFPYLIIYWIDEVNSLIIVLSIFHTSRRPKFF